MPTIQSLVIPVSDLDAAKAVYTALLGGPHTDTPYYVGYNVSGFEVALAPGDVSGGPVAYADVEDLEAARDTLLAFPDARITYVRCEVAKQTGAARPAGCQ